MRFRQRGVLAVLSLATSWAASESLEDAPEGNCSAGVECLDTSSSTDISSPAANATALGGVHEDNTAVDGGKCALYLAESSMPGTGHGVYAARSFRAGETVQPADSVSVTVTDRERHQPDGVMEYKWPHDNYYWGTYGQASYEAESVSEMVVTLGSLANYHTYLTNTRTWGFGYYDDSLLDRKKDPGAGAMSYYLGHDFVSTRDIEAGEEIFVSYGESWLDGRGDWGSLIPREADFETGDQITKLLKERVSAPDDAIVSLIKDIVALFDDRTSSVLPETSLEFSDATANGEHLAWSSVERRSMDWILENGQCLDNMVMKKSTIPQAGRGGFAHRFLPSGSVVVPVPLLQIVDRDSLDIYARDGSEKVWYGGEKVGKQVMLNYCFGHKDSSMILFPISNALLVNHCSTRKKGEGDCGEKGPNAAYRWSTWDTNTKKWLQMSLEEIGQEEGRGLTLEMYATRDIYPGEEIFIDYGEEWEEAWEIHVREWQPPHEGSGFADYASATKMNIDKEPLLSFGDEMDSKEGYADNIFTACIYWEEEVYEEDQAAIIASWEQSDWANATGREFLAEFGLDGKDYVFNNETHDWAAYWPCEVFFWEDDEGENFTVRIRQEITSDVSEHTWWHKANVPRFVENYPRESIKFFSFPYTSDQHLLHAFRHHIGIRDEIFPSHWKDKSY